MEWQRAWEARVMAWRARPDVVAWLASLPPAPSVPFGPVFLMDDDGSDGGERLF